MNVEDKIEAEIDALLARDETTSVVDALLAMPQRMPANPADERWEKSLNARLQARLAQKMREVLEEQESTPVSDAA